MKNMQTKTNQNSQNYQNLQNVVRRIIKKIYSEESGSAIILALIIIAGLAGTGLGAARLAKSNTQQASIYENSLKAYYAAEAGIEAALLEWRFDHNVEFWDQDMAIDCFKQNGSNWEDKCEAATVKKYVLLQGDEEANIEDISNRFDEYGELKEGYNTPKGQGWYEMEISYRNPRYPYKGKIQRDPGKVNDLNSYPDIIQDESDLVRIAKDETLEISFPKSDRVRKIDTYWNADIQDGNGYYSTMIVHPVVLDENGEDVIVPEEYVTGGVYFTERRDESTSYFGGMIGELYSVNLDLNPNNYKGVVSMRLKCLSTDPSGGCYVGVIANKGVNNASEDVFIPQDELVMKVTGHYGDVERIIEYSIDRESGTILDIFDHGVYSKETFRK